VRIPPTLGTHFRLMWTSASMGRVTGLDSKTGCDTYYMVKEEREKKDKRKENKLISWHITIFLEISIQQVRGRYLKLHNILHALTNNNNIQDYSNEMPPQKAVLLP